MHGARAVVNAIEFKEMLVNALSEKENVVLGNGRNFFFEASRQSALDRSLN